MQATGESRRLSGASEKNLNGDPVHGMILVS